MFCRTAEHGGWWEGDSDWLRHLQRMVAEALTGSWAQSHAHNLAEALPYSKCQRPVEGSAWKRVTAVIRSLTSDLALVWLAQNGQYVQPLQPFPTTGLFTSCAPFPPVRDAAPL